MKAVEFIKIHGWDYATLFASGWITFNKGCDENSVDRNDVQQYIDAYELVQSYKCKRYTGLSNAKDHVLTLAHIEEYEKINELQSAIYLVEEVEA